MSPSVLRSMLIKLVALVVALAIGCMFATWFRWPQSPRYEDMDMISIMAHNMAILVMSVLLGRYVAGPIYLCNAAYLGFALAASVLTVGVGPTIALTGVHVPLEVGAWVAGWIGAERWSSYVGASLRSKAPQPLLMLRPMVGPCVCAVLLLALAGIAEWFELQRFLMMKGGA